MLLLVLQMIPGILIMIPLFSTLRALKLVDTHFSLIFIYISTNLPFGILTMKGFFDSIPTELDEAAMIDGASPYQTYWKIVFPTAIPGMISVAVYTLMSVWNEFTIANIFIQSTELQTLSVSLRQFQLQTTTDWGALSAAAALACIPAFLFLIVVQKVPDQRHDLRRCQRVKKGGFLNASLHSHLRPSHGSLCLRRADPALGPA